MKSTPLKLGFTVIFAAIAVAYSLLVTPVYQANATLQYDKMSQVSLLDQMSNAMPFANSNTQADSEIEVIPYGIR